MRKTLLLIPFLVAFTALSLAQKPAHPDMLVTTEWLAAHLKDPNVVVLHLTKERKQYDEGHVPGARWISFDQLMVKKDGLSSELPPVEELVKVFESLGISNDSRVVVYSTNWPPLSTRIYFTLDYLGLGDRAAVLDGGMEKWKAEKREVSKEDAKASRPGKITPHVRPEIVIRTPEILAIVSEAYGKSRLRARLIDARPDSRYAEGHIPFANQLYWQQTVNKELPDQFLSFKEMNSVWENAVGTRERPIITYCEIGWQASHDYFTAKYLGYDVMMYDGSFQEWNDLKHLEVVKEK